MTTVSRSARRATHPRRDQPVRTGLSSLWPVSCILFSVSCLYVEPTWKPAINEPPTVLRLDPPMPQLLFEMETERVTVIVDDPEGRPIDFLWDLPPFAEFETIEQPLDGVTVARCDLRRDEALDNTFVRLTVIDAPDDEEPVLLDFEWRVEVP